MAKLRFFRWLKAPTLKKKISKFKIYALDFCFLVLNMLCLEGVTVLTTRNKLNKLKYQLFLDPAENWGHKPLSPKLEGQAGRYRLPGHWSRSPRPETSGKHCSSRNTSTVTSKLLEAQWGQVWVKNTRGRPHTFPEFNFTHFISPP